MRLEYSGEPAIPIPPWLAARVATETLAVGEGTLDGLLRVFGTMEPSVLVVGDDDTMAAAGSRVLSLLLGRYGDTEALSLGRGPHCDASTLAKVEAVLPGRRSLVAVGSGTINDAGRLAAHRHGVAFYSVATAPSMDGYLSANSSLVVNGVKVSYPGIAPPRAVLVDKDILRAAPRALFLAGIGDSLAKLVSTFDWHLDSLVRGTARDPDIARLLVSSAERLVETLLGTEAAEIGGKGIDAVTEYLLLSSAAMHAHGSSQPASGGEHLVSHVLEMFDVRDGSHGALHGSKVAVAVRKLVSEYPRFFSRMADRAGKGIRVDGTDTGIEAAWKARGIVMDGGIRTRKLSLLRALDAGAWARVFESMRQDAERLERLSPSILELYARYGMPGLPEDIGVSEADWAFACERAVDIRDRVTGLDLMLSLGTATG